MLSLVASTSRGQPSASLSPAESSAGSLLRRAAELADTDPPGALASAQQALAQARQANDRTALLDALLQVAQTARAVSDYAAAESAANEGLTLTQGAADARMRAEFYVVLGTMQWNQAQLSNATGSFVEALQIAESLGDKALLMSAHRGLGAVRDRLDDFADGLTHLQAALRLAEQLNDPPRLASALNSTGNHYLSQKDYPKAKVDFERALSLLGDDGNQRLRAYLLLNLGQIATETGDQALAGKRLADAMTLCQRYHLARGEADVWYLLAASRRRAGRPQEGIPMLARALAIAETLHHPDLFALIYDECVQTAEARGDYRSALDYARKLAEQTDAIRNEKSRQRAAELEARYGAEARAREIKLLQRDRELQQTELALTLAELSRVHTQRYALAAVLALLGLLAAALASRHRSRSRAAQRLLAKTQAARELAEEADALKERLLAVAKHDLSESEERFRTAFDHSALGLALVSPDGHWLRVNTALCRIVGYPPEELRATTFQALTHPDDLAPDLVCVEQLLRGERDSYHMEKRYFHKQGHLVWIRLDASLVRDPDSGQPLYFISQVQDITEQKRSQEALRQAKEEAEKANTAKSEFLSRMSHELRTPLNAILGFGQLLENDDLGQRHNQAVQHILTAGRHLLGLVNELLDVSRVESGRIELVLDVVSLGEVAHTAVDLVRPLAAQAGISLHVPALDEASPGCVMADSQRLKQVLLNLLSNAIKYNKEGGDVYLRWLEPEKGWMRIEVQDTGGGITESDLKKLFSPFARLPAALGKVGTGLGLSLSKTLVTAMGGTLGVNSTVGEGSTFWVEFARCEDAPPAELLGGDELAGIDLSIFGFAEEEPKDAPQPSKSV